MPAPQLTINEAAERLGVGASTLRTWGEKLGVEGARTSTGKRIYTDDDLAVLEVVKQLRDQDAGFETIRRQIGGASATHGEATAGDGEPTASAPPPHGGAAVLEPSVLIAEVVRAIGDQTELAEKYARATFELGKLTADNENLRNQLAAATERITLLEAPKPEPASPPRRGWWPWSR